MNDDDPTDRIYSDADIPDTYRVFRWLWSLSHILIFGVLLFIFIDWAITDHQGISALNAWLDWCESLRKTVSGLLHYPWE